jgi:hypothetical protein
MKQKIYLAVFLLGVAAASYAQSPLRSAGKYNDWEEQEGYALVNGAKLHYWLYNTYKYHDGHSADLLPHFFQWVEKLGWVVDYDNADYADPNKDLAKSVKLLMASRNCDMSITLFTSNNRTYLIINNWDRSKTGEEAYTTFMFPLLK